MTEHFLDTRLEASTAAAERMAELLANRLDNQSQASIIVSGGTSPRDCMAALAKAPLDWQRVQIALSDERWVPPDHEDSNEKLVRESLLVGRGRVSNVVARLMRTACRPKERCESLQNLLPVLPFAVFVDRYRYRRTFRIFVSGRGAAGAGAGRGMRPPLHTRYDRPRARTCESA